MPQPKLEALPKATLENIADDKTTFAIKASGENPLASYDSVKIMLCKAANAELLLHVTEVNGSEEIGARLNCVMALVSYIGVHQTPARFIRPNHPQYKNNPAGVLPMSYPHVYANRNFDQDDKQLGKLALSLCKIYFASFKSAKDSLFSVNVVDVQAAERLAGVFALGPYARDNTEFKTEVNTPVEGMKADTVRFHGVNELKANESIVITFVDGVVQNVQKESSEAHAGRVVREPPASRIDDEVVGDENDVDHPTETRASTTGMFAVQIQGLPPTFCRGDRTEEKPETCEPPEAASDPIHLPEDFEVSDELLKWRPTLVERLKDLVTEAKAHAAREEKLKPETDENADSDSSAVEGGEEGYEFVPSPESPLGGL